MFRAGKRSFVFVRRTNAVLAAIITACCALVEGAEIHDAAELGDLERVKAYLSQDPKQVDTTDAKGRTVLDCAILSGKKELVEFLVEKGATENIFADGDKAGTIVQSRKCGSVLSRGRCR